MNPDHPITLSVIREENLTTSGNYGTTVRETWAGLCRWVSWPIESDHKACGGFVLAHLRDGVRRKSHVITTSAVGIDYDAGMVTPYTASRVALAGVAHIIYSTWSSTPSSPRWRAIIPIDRPATVEEHPRLYAVVAAWFCAAHIDYDVPTDASTKDPCRLWYIPAKRPGGRFDVFVNNGEPLEVDRVLAIDAELCAEREAERAKRPPPPAPSTDKHAAYVAGAIRHAADNVRDTTPGERHGVLCKEAFALARLGLSEGQILAALEPAALHAMGPDRAREIWRTIADAVRARKGA